MLDKDSLNYMFNINHSLETTITAAQNLVIEISIEFINEPRNKEEYEKLLQSSIMIHLEFLITPV
ncbi:MAG: hypothetical protein GX312_04980 [Candidatus Phytoplasma sp.]|nr:hypothetical protein [Phytoplasma sp.]